MAVPQIQIGDNLLGNARLASVEVVQELNNHWWCTVCRNTEDQRIPIEQLSGQPVEVKTTDDQGTERVHFSGFIYNVRLKYELWGATQQVCWLSAPAICWTWQRISSTTPSKPCLPSPEPSPDVIKLRWM